MSMQYVIRYVYGHYNVYQGGRFLFSADTEKEAYEEIEAHQQDMAC